MIYLTDGVRQRRYDVFKETNGDFYHLVQMTKAPQVALNQTADQLAEYKLSMAKYVLYGRVVGVERADKVIGRTVLFIDIDDEGNYPDTSKRLNDLLEAYSVLHVIYPTISNNVKEGARLRAGVALDRSVTAEEYLKLWSVLLTSIGLHGDDTAVNKSFKQLQGLYVKTSQNAENEPIIYSDGHTLPVDEFIKIYDASPKKYRKNTLSINGFSVETSKKNVPNWAEHNKKFIACLLDPESNYMLFDGWDNMLTAVGGWTFKNTYGDVRTTVETVEAVNKLGSDPISNSELKHKFDTWFKRWSV